MKLIAHGINHKTAPIDIRERIIFTPDMMPEPLHDLVKANHVHEAAILSTCNRTEIYCAINDPEFVTDWLATRHRFSHEEIAKYTYTYQGQEAVKHMLRVASGLDSMVVGESQIFNQMKLAYQQANQAGTIGRQLKRLFQYVFCSCKDVRTTTQIGANPISIAYAAVDMAKRIFADLSKATVLLIGAGETIELAALHLHQQGVSNFIVANRHKDKAEHLAKQYKGIGVAIAAIPDFLSQADIIISATASPLPILGKGAVERAIKARKHKPIFMVDLAVPRDIEPEVRELADIYLYCIDDLQHVIAQNINKRHDAAEEAEAIIELQTQHYLNQRRIYDSAKIISDYREKIELLKQQELAKAMLQLQANKPAAEVLASLAHNITNKIMHSPTIQLREAAYNNEQEKLQFAKWLLDLNHNT